MVALVTVAAISCSRTTPSTEADRGDGKPAGPTTVVCELDDSGLRGLRSRGCADLEIGQGRFTMLLSPEEVDVAVVVDLGGPGAPFEAPAVRQALDAQLPGVPDFYVFREPWSYRDVDAACHGSSAPMGAWVLPSGSEPAADWSIGDCSSVQLDAADYDASIIALASKLQIAYSEVHVLGFSYGATRLRRVAPNLEPGTEVTFVEPGPHPRDDVGAWSARRQAAAADTVFQACQRGFATACEFVEAAPESDTDKRFRMALAQLYLGSQLSQAIEPDGLSVNEAARLALSVDAAGDVKLPGVGFLTGLCRDLPRPTGPVNYEHALEVILSNCGDATAAVVEDGTPRVCVVLNSADQLVGSLAGPWKEDPLTERVVDVQEPAQQHGALLHSVAPDPAAACDQP